MSSYSTSTSRGDRDRDRERDRGGDKEFTSKFLHGVVIKNLNKMSHKELLLETFASFGTVTACEIATNKNETKYFAFLNFASSSSAEKAIHRVNGMILNGNKVRLEKFYSDKFRPHRLEFLNQKFTKVFIKNFDDEMTDDILYQMCCPYGKLLNHKVVIDKIKHSAFAFVTFDNPEEAKLCVDSLNGYEFQGKQLYAGSAQKKAERQAELAAKYGRLNNLYVKNLEQPIDDNRLIQEFSKFGTITSAKVACENGVSRGFGFVCYATPEEAKRACDEMNGKVLISKPLYVSMAQRKDERKALLTAKYIQQISTDLRTQAFLQPQLGLMDPMTQQIYLNMAANSSLSSFNSLNPLSYSMNPSSSNVLSNPTSAAIAAYAASALNPPSVAYLKPISLSGNGRPMIQAEFQQVTPTLSYNNLMN